MSRRRVKGTDVEPKKRVNKNEYLNSARVVIDAPRSNSEDLIKTRHSIVITRLDPGNNNTV